MPSSSQIPTQVWLIGDRKEALSKADQRPPLEGGWLAGTPRAGGDTAKQRVPG